VRRAITCMKGDHLHDEAVSCHQFGDNPACRDSGPRTIAITVTVHLIQIEPATPCNRGLKAQCSRKGRA
jgi:hypothetical protein